MEITADSTALASVHSQARVLSHTHTATSYHVFLTAYIDCSLRYFSDANGNITQVADDTGNLVAAYEYDPFGGTVVSDGPEAGRNPFTFSSKYWDEEIGLVHFMFRHGDPLTGRWINRDPVGEDGGINLYGFAENEPIGRVDSHGLSATAFPWPPKGSWVLPSFIRIILKRVIGYDCGRVWWKSDVDEVIFTGKTPVDGGSCFGVESFLRRQLKGETGADWHFDCPPCESCKITKHYKKKLTKWPVGPWDLRPAKKCIVTLVLKGLLQVELDGGNCSKPPPDPFEDPDVLF